MNNKNYQLEEQNKISNNIINVTLFLLYIIITLLQTYLIHIKMDELDITNNSATKHFSLLIAIIVVTRFLYPNLFGIYLTSANLKRKKTSGLFLILVVSILCLYNSNKINTEIIEIQNNITSIILGLNILLIIIIITIIIKYFHKKN